MARLSHVLVQEIYAMKEVQMKPWTDNKEVETEADQQKHIEPTSLIQSQDSEDSSEKIVEDDLGFLKAVKENALDNLMNEEADYLSDTGAEEYDLFADDSTGQDYYKYD